MLLTDARRPARTGPHGELITMAEQDRAAGTRRHQRRRRADHRHAARHQPGPSQLQAAIAAVHDEAANAETTARRRSSRCTGCSGRPRATP